MVLFTSALVLLAAGCASSAAFTGSGSSSAARASDHTVRISTPAGDATVALDGHLPPGWPSDFPLPAGAKAAGSGSLTTSSRSTLVAVYSSDQAPETVFGFYRAHPGLKAGEPTSVGFGSAFAGELSFTDTFTGSMGVIGKDASSYFAIVLQR